MWLMILTAFAGLGLMPCAAEVPVNVIPVTSRLRRVTDSLSACVFGCRTPPTAHCVCLTLFMSHAARLSDVSSKTQTAMTGRHQFL